MKILHWNCQGLRNPLTVHYLKEIRAKYSPDIMFHTETVNKDEYVYNLGLELGYVNIFTLPPQGLSGGLAFFGIGMYIFPTITLLRITRTCTLQKKTFLLPHLSIWMSRKKVATWALVLDDL